MSQGYGPMPSSRVPQRAGPPRQIQHFRRARAMFDLVQSAYKQVSTELVQIALAAIPQYESRGHGEGLQHNKHSMRCVAQDKRDAVKRRNVVRNRRAHA